VPPWSPEADALIDWHLLSDPDARFIDLGPDFHAARTDPDRRMRSYVRQLQALGFTVTLEPAS
jgi:transposase